MRRPLRSVVLVVPLMLFFVNMTCDKNDDADNYNGSCDQITIVDSDMYNNLETDYFTFIEAEIVDDCLYIEFGSSGCDGNSWRFNLVDSGAVAESFPEQRYLKFQLKNEEACLAYFTRTVSFDLKPIQVSGSNEIILNIEGFEPSLKYKY
ncbi:hypothetical protein [Flavisericum labens]|uniref:hypothetical protein n=1 Tax=Flavisericum labens TaxID=3377112 RepID=UPI00387B37EA